MSEDERGKGSEEGGGGSEAVSGGGGASEELVGGGGGGGASEELVKSSLDEPFPMNLDQGEEPEDPAGRSRGEDLQTDDEVLVPLVQPASCDVEDVVSSTDEGKKVDSLASDESDVDLNLLMYQENKCLKELGAMADISPEVVSEVEMIFKQYRRAVSEKRSSRVESDVKLWWKLEDAEESIAGAPVAGPQTNRTQSSTDIPAYRSGFEVLQNQNNKLSDENEVLKRRIAELEKEVDKIDKGDEGEMEDKTIAAYVKEVGKLKRELDTFENKIQDCHQDMKKLENKLDRKERECLELEEIVKKYKDEALKYESRKRSVEADMENANLAIDQLKMTMDRHQVSFLKTVEQLTMKDDENLELKKAVGGFNNQQRCLSKYIVELRDRLEFLSKIYIQVEDQNSRLKAMCSEQKDALQFIKNKSVNLEKLEDKWLRRLERLTRRCQEAEARTKGVTLELNLKHKEVQKVEDEKIILNKKLIEAQKAKDESIGKYQNLIVICSEKENRATAQQKTIEKLNVECSDLKLTIERQQKEINDMNRQTNTRQTTLKNLEDENEVMSAALQRTLEHLLNSEKEIKSKEREVKDMVADYNNLLQEKQILRNRLLQTHGLAKDNEFKIRYLDSVIAYDKHKLDRSDDIIKNLQYKVQKLQYDYNSLKVAFKQRKLQIRKLVEEINSKEMEKGSLDRLLQKGETIRIEIIKDAERLRQDASILNTVVQRRNAEISLVYEKTELMSTLLNSGEHQMKQRLFDIHLLKTEVSKLRAENKMLIKSVQNNANLKEEINFLQKDLSQAKQKCCALEQQMENPINIHRWRILKGKDPDKNALLEENQTLRKKLLAIEDKNIKLKEKSQNLTSSYHCLTEKLKKTPQEIDCTKKLLEAQRIIRNRNDEIQRLSVTLSSYQFNMKEIEKDVENKKRKADECMKKYYDLKRKQDKENLNKTDEELLDQLPFPKTCFSESKEDLMKRILYKPANNKMYEGTGLTIPKAFNKL